MAEHQKFKIKSLIDLRALSERLKLDIPVSEDLDILFKPIDVEGRIIPNRMVVQPMEGFDSLPDGSPGELTSRRYCRYAKGGSGMIWFEATSVMQEGRSNPGQLLISRETLDDFKRLVDKVRETARVSMGSDFNPFLVLQLTHSGRFSKPEGVLTGKYFSDNPYLNPLTQSSDRYTDEELEKIRDHYIEAILLADHAGFDSVDIKVSHGYLLHELLASYTREGSIYGGSFERRTDLIRQIVDYPTSLVRSIRLNATDLIPYPYGFGMRSDCSLRPDLAEPKAFIRKFEEKVPLWNITAGIPYYNPHVNRPYDRGLIGSTIPPEHPLEGVARMINVTGEIQQDFPGLPIVGSAYSWLRQFFPYVAAGVLRRNMATFIGVGRSAFAYPDAPRDLLNNGLLNPKKVCTSCSRCTQFMRDGMSTGCSIRDKEIYKSKV